nr:alkyl hydroperoxide reductase [Bacteriovorax sp. HI3]
MNNQIAKTTLKIAALYNVVWGALIIFFPHALFDFAGLPRMNYPGVWQCVGMIVGVYGVGYWVAASDPRRHWPIVLVGFLGKIFGPIGFIQALYTGVFNLKFGLTIITNDLVWWIPFFLILKQCSGEMKSYLAGEGKL